MSSTAPVPDAPGPVVGWRYWYVDGGRLRSLDGFVYTRWPAGRALRAQCSSLLPHGEGTPAAGCRCGIYAASNLATLKRLTNPNLDGPLAVGQVALWGRVVPGEQGYRAEYGYPRRLWVLKESLQQAGSADALRRHLATAYSVPVGLCSATWALGGPHRDTWTPAHPASDLPGRRLRVVVAGRALVLLALGGLGALFAPRPGAYLFAWALACGMVAAATLLGFGVMVGRVTVREFVAVQLTLPLLFGGLILTLHALGPG